MHVAAVHVPGHLHRHRIVNGFNQIIVRRGVHAGIGDPGQPDFGWLGLRSGDGPRRRTLRYVRARTPSRVPARTPALRGPFHEGTQTERQRSDPGRPA